MTSQTPRNDQRIINRLSPILMMICSVIEVVFLVS